MVQRNTLSILILFLVCLVGCGGQTPSPTAGDDGLRAETTPPPVAPELDIPNAATPVDGILVGGQPSVEMLQSAAELGYGTVINLRADVEDGLDDEEGLVTGLGMRYVHIPVEGVEGLNLENARLLHDALAEAETEATLVHCASGNRVGALFALRGAFFEGLSTDDAIALGESAGLTRLADAARGAIEAHGAVPAN